MSDAESHEYGLAMRSRSPVGALVVAAVLALPAAASGWSVPARSTISGPAGLPAACGALAAESFPVLGVDPGDPDRLTAVYASDGIRGAAVARSGDGGATWAREPLTGATTCTGGPAVRRNFVNPQMAAGPQGRAWFGNSWISGEQLPVFRYGVTVHHRDAAGWSAGSSPDGPAFGQNVSVVPDPVDPQRAVAVWVHHDSVPVPPLLAYVPVATEVRAATTRDGGRTWSAPVRVHPIDPARYAVNVRAVRAADGGIVAVYDTVLKTDLVNFFIGRPASPVAYAVRSGDGGRTWAAPVGAGPVGSFDLDDPEDREPPGADDDRIALQAKFDVGAGPGGTVLVVSSERRGDGGVVRVAESRDNGRSFSAPRDVLTRDTPPFMTAVAVDGTGTPGVFFYDFAEDVAGDAPLSTTPWLATPSGAGGWSATALDTPFDLRSAFTAGVLYDGDSALGVTQDLVGLPQGFGAAYTVAAPHATDGKTDVRFARAVP